MDAGHHLRAFADRAADPLDRARAHVADREDARDARLEQLRLVLRQRAGAGAAGDDEAGLVQFEAALRDQAGLGFRADEHEQVLQRQPALLAVATVAPADGLQRVAAFELAQLLVRQQLDVGGALDAVDQVARHRRRQPRAADQHDHLGRVIGQEHRRLAGRVAAADDHHRLPAADAGLDRRGPVPDAPALEARQRVEVGTAVARAGGDHRGARPHRAAVLQRQAQLVVLAVALAAHLGDLGRDQHVGAELLGLDEGPARQRLARDAGREAEVVLDARARAGLAAERAAVHHQHRQPLRRRVHRGRQARRAGADDGHVVELGALAHVDDAHAAGDLLVGRVDQHVAAGADDQHLHALAHVLVGERLGVVVLVGLELLVRIAVAAQEAAQPHHRRGLGPPDQRRAAGAGLDQADAAQDEGAGEALAQVGLGDQQRAQLRRADLDRLDLGFRDRVDERGPAAELADLAQETARAVPVDRRHVAEAVALGDGDLAAEDQGHAHAGIAGTHDPLALGIAPEPAEARDARDVGDAERGKHLGTARVGDAGLLDLGHGTSWRAP